GEILDFDLTPGNVADNNHSLLKRILGKVKGLCFGDKDYSTALWKDFFQQGLKIITKSKSKAKAKLMLLNERYML
ncbi:transposase, partial [Chryseobacterium mucoviscidosis]|uniref:transposase n=1 Tax=Chryseobacterium mucoviscidosis TaxID=1945581 RepID=UPI00301A3586